MEKRLLKDNISELVKLIFAILIILITSGIAIFNHINKSQIESIQASIKLKFQNRQEEDPAKVDGALYDKAKSNIGLLLQKESLTILKLIKRLRQFT